VLGVLAVLGAVSFLVALTSVYGTHAWAVFLERRGTAGRGALEDDHVALDAAIRTIRGLGRVLGEPSWRRG
jgi:hypothetical protein